jgi:hypothetical protein
MEKFMKIAKKLTKVLVAIVVVVTLVTLGWYLYQEQTDKVDEVVALECPAVSDLNSNPVSFRYYMLQSSRGSRESSDYYKDAYLIETDFSVPPIGSDIEKYKSELEYYINDEFIVIRSLKYIHLFNNLSNALQYLEKQREIPAPKELVDIRVWDSWKNFDAYLPYYSFNRETLERTHWSREFNANLFEIKPVIKECKEVDPSIPLNLVKQNIDKASSGDKKI